MEVKLDFSLGVILTIIFFVLKATGFISWSWIWIFSPLWISVIISLTILLIFWIKYKRWL